MIKTVKKAFGTHYIAGICQVTRHTVARWIEEGKLPSFMTGGGQRRVWDRDLVVFLAEHKIPIPPELEVISKTKILIVDDESEVRRLITKVLRKTYPAAEVYEAADGFEAGQKTISLMPSVLILDIQLPGVSGLKICQMLRSDEKLKRIKILAITGQDVEEMKAQVLAAGADDFLGKPFSPEELSQKLKKLIVSTR